MSINPHRCLLLTLLGKRSCSVEAVVGPFVDVDALVLEILCEENAIFLAMDEAIADEIFESNEEHIDAIGAIDGSHVPAHILREKQGRYRNRKGVVSQNVMGVCGFDLVFQYVGVGFEGAAADMAILRRAMDVGGFHVLEGGREDEDDELEEDPNLSVSASNMMAGGAGANAG
ncbi:hypothetical protein Taro_025381 [Colocasia esculenta]|uniref:Transposase n=1 Tax=Colocasia esculenta TaxID=4460 RepID=A0A843VE29_COLES|nr:hypothetical protein [Colocasia esculenta]